PKAQMMSCQERVDRLPRNFQHRTEHGDRSPADGHLRNRSHATNPGRSRSAEKVEQTRLDLIVGVMCEKKKPAPFGRHAPGKKHMPQFPGGRLDRQSPLLRILPDISPT